jgi:hypothetical protein
MRYLRKDVREKLTQKWILKHARDLYKSTFFCILGSNYALIKYQYHMFLHLSVWL